MPELPDVEAMRRVCQRRLKGRRIESVLAVRDERVFAGLSRERLERALTGRTVRATGRRGKHMWIELDRTPWLVLHFGMTGRLDYYRDEAERPKFWKLELTLDNGLRMAYVNIRRLGRVHLVDDVMTEPPVAELGPDAKDDLPNAKRLGQMLREHSRAIKALLMDQSFLAGLGNWTVDESLYRARIEPHRQAHSLRDDEVRRLRQQIRYVLDQAIGFNMTGRRPPANWLYHHRDTRGSEIAGHHVLNDIIGGRRTYWVEGVQE